MKTTIRELFNIEWGQKEYHSKEHLEGKDGKTILIASGGIDNGVYGFYDIPIKYKAPFITVQSTGTIGYAFLQEKDCCVNDDVLILKPKIKLNTNKLLQVVYQIRQNRWRYAYGRKITPTRLLKQKIVIEEVKTDFDKLGRELLPKEKTKEAIPKCDTIKLMKVKELCKIEKKISKPQSDINLDGNVPYVSASSKNNGVPLFVGEKPNSKAGSLTIAKDGNDGCAFFHPFDFVTSLHNYILSMMNNLPRHFLFYIGAIVKMKSSRYNHYYPLSKRHLERMEIPIPYKNGKIDVTYVERIVKNSYGFDEIKGFL